MGAISVSKKSYQNFFHDEKINPILVGIDFETRSEPLLKKIRYTRGKHNEINYLNQKQQKCNSKDISNLTKSESNNLDIIKGNDNKDEKNLKEEVSISSSRNILSSYLDKAYAKIENNKYYPRIEKRRNHEGIVTISFFIKKDGKIDRVNVFNKSSYDLLSEAALLAVKRAAPFDIIPFELGKEEISVKVNLVYSLK